MKVNCHHKLFAAALILFATAFGEMQAQDSLPSAKILSLRYFLPQNNAPYLELNTQKKTGKKLEPVKHVPVNVYFNEVAETNLLGKIITSTNGTGRMAFPASFKNTWDSLTEFKFVAASVPARGEEPLNAEITIKKAILVIDTLPEEGTRTVTAQLKEKAGKEWVPVKDIEMKLMIKRLLGDLSVGDAETYTADSTGIASAGFIRDSLPGNEKGQLTLVAKVEDNDSYGNLVAEKKVAWGKPVKAEAYVWHRTLWATGNRAPAWLLLIASSVIIGVWGTLIYLVFQLVKIIKMGREHERKPVTSES